MGIVVQFPADAVARPASGSVNVALRKGTATVLILPVIRIERHEDQRDGGSDDRKTPARRRRRRARS